MKPAPALWNNTDASGYLERALVDLNRARELCNRPRTEVCRAPSHSFNQLWTGFNTLCGEGGRSDSKPLRLLLETGLKSLKLKGLLASPEVSEFLGFLPRILNHDVLLRRSVLMTVHSAARRRGRNCR